MRDCCKDEKNLTVTERSKDRVVRVCQVCRRRHLELGMEPGNISVRMDQRGADRMGGGP